MLDYTFQCPHCGRDVWITEKAVVIRLTNLIGFGEEDPEFSTDEVFADVLDTTYVCSGCDTQIDIPYNDIYAYVKEHGSIEEENEI